MSTCGAMATFCKSVRIFSLLAAPSWNEEFSPPPPLTLPASILLWSRQR
jgi:hypothetical protein